MNAVGEQRLQHRGVDVACAYANQTARLQLQERDADKEVRMNRNSFHVDLVGQLLEIFEEFTNRCPILSVLAGVLSDIARAIEKYGPRRERKAFYTVLHSYEWHRPVDTYIARKLTSALCLLVTLSD